MAFPLAPRYFLKHLDETAISIQHLTHICLCHNHKQLRYVIIAKCSYVYDNYSNINMQLRTCHNHSYIDKQEGTLNLIHLFIDKPVSK